MVSDPHQQNLELMNEQLRQENQRLRDRLEELTGKRFFEQTRPGGLCQGPGDCMVCQITWCAARKPF